MSLYIIKALPKPLISKRFFSRWHCGLVKQSSFTVVTQQVTFGGRSQIQRFPPSLSYPSDQFLGHLFMIYLHGRVREVVLLHSGIALFKGQNRMTHAPLCRFHPRASSSLTRYFVLEPLVISLHVCGGSGYHLIHFCLVQMAHTIMSSDRLAHRIQCHSAIPTTCYLPILCNCIAWVWINNCVHGDTHFYTGTFSSCQSQMLNTFIFSWSFRKQNCMVGEWKIKVSF